MNIEVHYDGYFDILQNKTYYIGGKVSEIADFDSDKMSWFELRYLLKNIGVVKDYLVFQLLPNQPFESGLVEINSDKAVLEMMTMLSLERNIVLYILNSSNAQKELLPDYCLEEPCTKGDNVSENDKGKRDMMAETDSDQESTLNDMDEITEGDLQEAHDCDPIEHLESVYTNSDSLHTTPNLDDECISSKYPIVNTRNLDHSSLEVGMEFESGALFRQFMRQLAIKESFDLCWVKNEGHRIVVKCKASGCQFRVYAALNSSSGRFQIRTVIPNHSCTKALTNSQVTSTWLAKKYLEQFRTDPNMTWKVFRSTVQREVGVTVSKSSCYRAKQKALDIIHGKYFEQFEKIREYAQALLESNPGSYAIVKTKEIVGEEDSVGFEAIFISYAACLYGLVNGCRPIIGMDGCHLSSVTGGILLSAVARDPNNQMFPIAFAVVEVENKNTWTWFISILVEAVGMENMQGLTFITDRQKGLVESLKLLVPNADIRFCVKHLYGNYKEKFKGLKLKNLLWQAATAYSKEEHEEAMKSLQKINQDAFNYLAALDKQLWTRSHFNKLTRCDLLCNNISEAFNRYILDARDKPIITMLEMIRRQLMTRLQNKREKMIKCQSLLCPKIMEKLNDISIKSRECTTYYAGSSSFEVREKGKHCCVNLADCTCDCQEWMLTGIPCKHAVTAIRHIRGDPISYTHECYSTSKYTAAYAGTIIPIPHSSKWKEQEGFKILPPKARKQPGRPPKARKKAADEPKEKLVCSRAGQVLKCSQCKQVGHNKRRCHKRRSNQQGGGGQEDRSNQQEGRSYQQESGSNQQEGNGQQSKRKKIPVSKKKRVDMQM